MGSRFITLDRENISGEHICCGFSDKKCVAGYGMKKEWMKDEFGKGFVFRRLDDRAKVFIEYGPAEDAWIPVTAPGYMMLGCFWVSGKYKGHGYGKELLDSAMNDAEMYGKKGLVAVVGTKKFHFMNDTKWLLQQGFVECDRLPYGFSLLVKKTEPGAANPEFGITTRSGRISHNEDIVAFHSDRCPFTDHYVRQVLPDTAAKRGYSFKAVKFDSRDAAQASPTPATIFSLYFKGRFATTDLSVCLDNRFGKILDLE